MIMAKAIHWSTINIKKELLRTALLAHKLGWFLPDELERKNLKPESILYFNPEFLFQYRIYFPHKNDKGERNNRWLKPWHNTRNFTVLELYNFDDGIIFRHTLVRSVASLIQFLDGAGKDHVGCVLFPWGREGRAREGVSMLPFSGLQYIYISTCKLHFFLCFGYQKIIQLVDLSKTSYKKVLERVYLELADSEWMWD